MQDWTSQMLFLFPIIGRLDIKYPWRGACRILLSYDCGGTVDLGVCEFCRSTAKLTHGAHCVKHHVWWRVVPIKCGASMRHIRTNMCQEKPDLLNPMLNSELWTGTVSYDCVCVYVPDLSSNAVLGPHSWEGGTLYQPKNYFNFGFSR